ncbi:hypothetical protein BS50DRAFT_134761 [Corynespora cassiicola Philippines]|uniref:Uncharacterized protein n=1 Tax=Corynespora cassiicola Philippines TaxID=1448308 RepID=A0A2T2N9A8_CORCC|nr:hypothetical protein BS50DRAFT_134761 [Corynespora cassiicola Philippines]
MSESSSFTDEDLFTSLETESVEYIFQAWKEKIDELKVEREDLAAKWKRVTTQIRQYLDTLIPLCVEFDQSEKESYALDQKTFDELKSAIVKLRNHTPRVCDDMLRRIWRAIEEQNPDLEDRGEEIWGD